MVISMDIIVTGGSNLKGNVICSGAKNAALPLLCASLLAKGKVLFKNVPRISDIFDICEILKYLDCKVIFKGHTILIDNTKLKYKPLCLDVCKRLRGSYYFIGVFLALFFKCEIALPGGCKIGNRPLDVHLQAFTDLGYHYEIENNVLNIYKTSSIEEASIQLTKKSVGASLNSLFAGMSLNHFELQNGLFEPEGQDVIRFLQKIGYDISYRENTIRYKKMPLEFKLIKHTIIPDRIEALTYTVLGLLKGDITVKKVNTADMAYPLKLLKSAGYRIEYTENEITAKKSFGRELEITTDIYPGFPTDLQSIFGVLYVNTIGASKMTETIFENRMHIYADLKESGVECSVEKNTAVVCGTDTILSQNYKAYDLRHGAAVLILALLGNQKSKISNFEYVLRGYDDILHKVKSLGGRIEVIEETE